MERNSIVRDEYQGFLAAGVQSRMRYLTHARGAGKTACAARTSASLLFILLFRKRRFTSHLVGYPLTSRAFLQRSAATFLRVVAVGGARARFVSQPMSAPSTQASASPLSAEPDSFATQHVATAANVEREREKECEKGCIRSCTR